MMYSILPYGKKSIWYLEESNADLAKQYQRVFHNLINYCRKLWDLEDFQMPVQIKKHNRAKAEIVDNKTIIVYSNNLKKPVAVRYGWANNPDDVNLYNKEDLPANPFRTDNWQGITK